MLPISLSKRLKKVSNQCYSGIGFNVIHGLNPALYTPEQNVIIYAGVATHIFPQRGFVDRAFERVLCPCIWIVLRELHY